MHTNVENVLERDRKLGDLEERADALQDGCAQFEKQVQFGFLRQLQYLKRGNHYVSVKKKH